jgi:4'-phosphopantetheinyl transferase
MTAPIASNIVHLHRLDLDTSPAGAQEWRNLLDESERLRADRFRMSTVQRRWTVARAGLRSILSSYCGCHPAALEFSRGIFGKPVLAGRSSRSRISFNLSHSEAVAVIAVSVDADLGIDVERKKRIQDWQSVARRFFSARENAELMSLQESARLDAFYDVWTRKEAIIKATGEGLHARLDEFDVALSPGAMIRVVADYSDEQKYVGWRLHTFEPGSGYSGALATPAANKMEMIDHGAWKIGRV